MCMPLSQWVLSKIERKLHLILDRGPPTDSGTKITPEPVRGTDRSCCAADEAEALITRALSEMTRVGNAYGANPLTFLGLAGVGDLILTCSSPLSRNYTVGRRLAEGEKLEDILKNLGSVAEGVATSKALKSVIDDLKLDLPIANSVR